MPGHDLPTEGVVAAAAIAPGLREGDYDRRGRDRRGRAPVAPGGAAAEPHAGRAGTARPGRCP